jgi:hypothetical protein
MKPEEEALLIPTNNMGGNMGGNYEIALGNENTYSCPLSLRSNNSSLLLSCRSSRAVVMLCIFPKLGSARYGYVYLATNKLSQANVITAYFNSAGQEIERLPCPNFNTCMAKYNLFDQDVLFMLDLPCYIIPAGLRILQANCYEKKSNLDWLLAPQTLSALAVLALVIGHAIW